MLTYKIFSKNFNIFIVTVITIILSSLNSNKIIVNSYQLNSHHKIDDTTRTLSSLPSKSLSPSSSTVLHEHTRNQHHKSNHHSKLNNRFNTQQLQQNQNEMQQQRPQHHYNYLQENRKYLHHIPTSATFSKSHSTSSSLSTPSNKEQISHIEFNKKNNDYSRDTNNYSSSSSSNSNHKILDEAKHPFSFSLPPTHILNSNQNNYKNSAQQLHQSNSNSAINLKKNSHSTPILPITTMKPIKPYTETHQYKNYFDYHHRHHNNVNSTKNIEILNENKVHSKSQNITMAPQLPPSISSSSSSSFLSDAIIKEGAALKFPLRKNPQDQNNIVLQRQQEHKQKQQQQQHHEHHQMNHQKYYPITDINESKSKSYHKTETTPKHSTELIGRHHHYREHNYNQHHHAHHYNDNHKKIVNINPNIDKMKKNHKTYNINNDENENQNENDNDNNNVDEENDNDKTNKNIINEDENNEDDDEDDYYYYNEDRNVDNDDDDDNDYDDDNIKENHGILGSLFNNFESKIKDIHINKNSHNVHKKIILNRDYHDNVNDDDGDLNENYNDNDHEDQYQRRYQHVDDDIDLIKKDLINHHEIFNNFKKDFDLYDYIDDEPKDENNTKNNEKSESLTEEKWEKYGSPKAVANSRRRYYSEVQKVNAHIMRVGYEAECRIPKPKIIQISEPSKRYVPHCTIIHKCGDDTGCCQSDFRTCVMKKSQIIDLYFYVVPLGTKEPIVETLSFENHTECHCVERERYRPTSSSSSVPLQLIKNDTGNLIQNQQQQQQQLNLNFSLPCKCAKYFTVFEDNNNNNDDNNNNNNNKKNCRCDCVSNDTACLRFKQGEEGFPMDDRNCVIKEGCTVPTCEFGDYSISEGRCPRNEHKRYIRTWNFD